ncbi:MAG: DUF2892 domain-containing protein [Candidatus Marinimicrobia bacterium]|jgi:hypothetical protein|nr:DUF2892 domain-containing protein [Candidatus Neomarinimicrobiota bacterium]MBT3634236.1 DUF2892 domain-containing protein [Candidatus Neomarinimicrobiota bacterium]MBT3682965.1 DUF2892 domain-containing protein [Candidatus Neomarinimicrobiota bacterium]MBT3760045.1 DUF2892 domain-containing protein [Candidatus Neomarinimicrobiota bacterium]MBT3896188.1 DUF2892 domain-containing protein [Candidatus Neomarinimicrobiota bacterium]
MKCNVGKTDRMLRILLGLVILGANWINYYALGGEYCAWANIGFIPLLTGIFRCCPVYLPFKFDTSKSDS